LSFDKSLALFFSLMILGQAYWVRRVVGTWLFPACLFGLFWFGFSFFPLAVLFWVPVHPYAVGFLFLNTVAFSLGSVPFGWKAAFRKNAQKRDVDELMYGSLFLERAFYVFTIAALLCVILDSLAQGVSLHDLLFDLLASAASYADLRYGEMLDVTFFGRFSSIFAYMAVILGGFLFPYVQASTKRRLVVVFSFLPSTLIAVAQSSKWTFFACIPFFYAGVLVHRINSGKLRLLEKVHLRSVAICAVLLAAIMTISFLTRGALFEQKNENVIIDRLVLQLASYPCVHIYAFSDWFSFSVGGQSTLTYPRENITYGFYTFAPLFRVMGSHKAAPPGYFDDYYSYSDFLLGNIFTMFRGLITDFGFGGSLVFMLGTGLLFHWAFHVMLSKSRPVFAVSAFVFMMGYFYFSFVMSIWSASTPYLTFLLLWMVLRVNDRVTRSRDHLAVTGAANEVPVLP
jgi:oligosaccharide repeat unit polymerase